MAICMWYTMVSAYELKEKQVSGGQDLFLRFICA